MRLVAWTALFLLACGSDGGTKPSTPSPSADGGLNNPAADSGGTLEACAPSPKCDGGTNPDVGTPRAWKHSTSTFIVGAGSPNHRGRDQIVPVGNAQWIIGKIAYAANDKDLKDEEVDLFVERGCTGKWEKLGTVSTTDEEAHPTVEGVEDSGGRVYFEIPKDKALPLGRHRIRLVVGGDLTFVDMFLDIVPANAKIFVSDVDGTLTESENAEFPALLEGDLPKAQPTASEVMRSLADLGYRPVYLTARPEWLTGRTREFLDANQFPPGIIHTTTTLTGATGDAAAAYKSNELDMLVTKKLTIAWAFGNKASDTDAYDKVGVEPKDHRVFLQIDDTHGGRRIEAYADVLSATKSSPRLCTR